MKSSSKKLQKKKFFITNAPSREPPWIEPSEVLADQFFKISKARFLNVIFYYR